MSGVVTQSLHSLALGSFHWQLRLFPCFPTTGNIPKLLKAQRLHNARGYARAIAAAAIDRRRFLAIKFTHSFTKLGYKNVTCTGNMTLFPFTRRTHIDDLQRRFSFIQFVYAHLPDSFEREPRRMPRFHSADQIAGEFRVSGPHEQ